MADTAPVVVVTGANGMVGARVCTVLLERGAQVRAVVRRPGTAPQLPGVTEHVGDFYDPALAREVVTGADAVVTTVHPMAADRQVQHEIAVEGTPVLARAAREAGVALLVHVSTAAVYDRSPGTGDVSDGSPLVDDDGGDYPVTKRNTDHALAEVDGLTAVLVRPPAILGAGETSVWNTLRPGQVRDGEGGVNPNKSFSWVHVDDLAGLIADVATGVIPTATDPAAGPVEGTATPVVVAGEHATWRDYHGAVTQALGVQPQWTDEPVWTGRLVAARATGWGWSPTVGLAQATDELRAGLRA